MSGYHSGKYFIAAIGFLQNVTSQLVKENYPEFSLELSIFVDVHILLVSPLWLKITWENISLLILGFCKMLQSFGCYLQ